MYSDCVCRRAHQFSDILVVAVAFPEYADMFLISFIEPILK